ncbi:MAG TPA: hypothetical protein VNO53_08665 [Steroidobacteraceae bacterium]|nr:hypothetical protein [Steroidobacteraceae bacterium]
MTAIAALWLPIVVSAVIVFIASSIIHMAPLWHRGELPAPPDADRLQDAMRPFGLQPGEYMLPRGKDMKDCNTPEFVEKLKRGPVVLMTVVANGPMSMSKPLVQWFIFTVAVSILVAYLAGATLAPDAPYLAVFRVAGTVAFIAYAVGAWQQSIWYNRPWSTTLKLTLDGLIYGLLTGGVFGWLWHMG